MTNHARVAARNEWVQWQLRLNNFNTVPQAQRAFYNRFRIERYWRHQGRLARAANGALVQQQQQQAQQHQQQNQQQLQQAQQQHQQQLQRAQQQHQQQLHQAQQTADGLRNQVEILQNYNAELVEQVNQAQAAAQQVQLGQETQNTGVTQPQQPQQSGTAPAAHQVGAPDQSQQVEPKEEEEAPQEADVELFNPETEIDYELIEAQRGEFSEDHPPEFSGPTWEPGWDPDSGKTLGQSHTGVARLYLRRDEHKNIVDRIVVKDVFLDHESWTAFHKWHGPPADKVPMEAHCMLAIRDKPGSEFCVRIRGWPKVVLNERRYRSYMEYYPYKSLDYLLRGEEQMANGQVKHFHMNRPIPEPAVWSIFGNLVDACLLLQNECLDPDNPEPNWTPIVYRDFKLDNIWLAEPIDGGDFPSYPTAVLGDLGLAVRTTDSDPLNPVGYNDGSGLDGWRAPEQCIFVRKGTNRSVAHPLLHEHKLGEHTNVWGIGAIMIRLMNRDPEEERELLTFEDKDTRELKVDRSQTYSGALIRAVEYCAEFDPENRHDLRSIKRWILEKTTGDGVRDDLARGLRRNTIGPNDTHLRLRYPRDQYQLKLAREDDDAGDEGSG